MRGSDTILANKLSRAQHCDRCLLAVHGDHGNLDFALLDIKDTVGSISLGKNRCSLRTIFNRSSQPCFGKKIGGIEPADRAPVTIPRPWHVDEGSLDGACPLRPSRLHGRSLLEGL